MNRPIALMPLELKVADEALVTAVVPDHQRGVRATASQLHDPAPRRHVQPDPRQYHSRCCSNTLVQAQTSGMVTAARHRRRRPPDSQTGTSYFGEADARRGMAVFSVARCTRQIATGSFIAPRPRRFTSWVTRTACATAAIPAA